LRITALRNVDLAELRPLSAGVVSGLQGNIVTLRLTKPGSYFLKWDGTFQLPFYIFANPPQAALSASAIALGSRSMPGLIEFGPGVHKPGLIRLRSGQTLHLAAGAEVHGTVLAEDASDIRICGRGVLRGSSIPFGGTSDHRYMVALRRCKRVVVEGIRARRLRLEHHRPPLRRRRLPTSSFNCRAILRRGRSSTLFSKTSLWKYCLDEQRPSLAPPQ